LRDFIHALYAILQEFFHLRLAPILCSIVSTVRKHIVLKTLFCFQGN